MSDTLPTADLTAVFTEHQLRALVVDGAFFRLTKWVRRLQGPVQGASEAKSHKRADRTRRQQPVSQPAQLYSDIFEGDMPPRQLLQLLADTDSRLRAGQSIPVMSPAEERRLTHSSAPSISKASKRSTRIMPPHSPSGRSRSPPQRGAPRSTQGHSQPPARAPGHGRRPPQADAFVDGRLYRPLVPQATSSLTAHGAKHNLQALHQAAQRHSALTASPRRITSTRSRSPTPGSPHMSARSGDMYLPQPLPLAKRAQSGEFNLPAVEDAAAAPREGLRTPPKNRTAPSAVSDAETPPPLTKKQLRRQKRAEKALKRELHIAAMAAPVPHKMSHKVLTRRQRLQQELDILTKISRDAQAGLPVTAPAQSTQAALDSNAIQLNVSSKADNELVMAVSRARVQALHAVELQRLGMLPATSPNHGTHPAPQATPGSKPAAGDSASGGKLPQVFPSSSPYSQGLVKQAGAGGWTTSAQSRPLTSPLRQRNKLYDGLMQRPMASARQDLNSEESDGMASV